MQHDTNARLKNYYKQKNIGYIENSNKEEHFAVKKVHLNR